MLTLAGVAMATVMIVLVAIVARRGHRDAIGGPATPPGSDWEAIVAELRSGRLARDPSIGDNAQRRGGPRPPRRPERP